MVLLSDVAISMREGNLIVDLGVLKVKLLLSRLEINCYLGWLYFRCK
jgi:hypothetical protein